MILEFRDITGKDAASGHVPMPADWTLGRLVRENREFKELEPHILRVQYNGAPIANWRDLCPAKNDKVRITVKPGDFGISEIILAITLLSSVISITQFIIGIFNKPKAPSVKRKDNNVYGFEGIRTSYVPGDPIPVPYGQHRVGGQVLSLYVDLTNHGKKQEMNMMLGLGEGDITEVNCFRVNDIPIENISSATAETRLGSTSQAPIIGFETIKNTFADGREMGSATPIIYNTNTTSLVTARINVGALEGMVKYTAQGERESTWTEFSVERRPTGTTTFTIVGSPVRFAGKSVGPIWMTYVTTVTTPAAYDFRMLTLRSRSNNDGPPLDKSLSKGRLWLSNVTEIAGQQHVYSGTALAALKAVATSQLNGATPDVSMVMRGRQIRRYTNTTSFVTEYNQIPAWHVLDYMTNSIYGMGFANSRMALQSFIDFATLCNSLVPDGKGGTEVQFQHDRIINERQSHWEHVNDILGLYRSAILYSQEQYKIITDRQDLPVRQVFHAGNMVAGETKIRIGIADPNKPNFVRAHFNNQEIDYNRDMIFVDSIAAGESMRDYEIQLPGIVRESEARRAASWDLERRVQIRREIEFVTGLEGIAVEPGDRCRVGVVMTDYEAGYGGRALDGSTAHLVADQEFSVKSGYTYDLFVWHTLADTVENRTLANTVTAGNPTVSYIVASPTAAFDSAIRAGDRWAIGVTSEDLMLATVKKVTRNEDGATGIIAEEFRTANVITPILTPRDDNDAPGLDEPVAQPMGAVLGEEAATIKDGTIVSKIFIDVSPAPLFEGGRTTVPGTTASVTLAQSHNPNADALVGERLKWISGAASGATHMITAWAGAGTRVATVNPTFASPPASGDPYTLIKKAGEFAGFDLEAMVGGADSDFGYVSTNYGTIAEFATEAQSSQSYAFRIIPFNRRSVRNYQGTWTLSLTTYGDTVAPLTPSGLIAAQGTGRQVLLDWADNVELDLSHYALYRSEGNSFGGAALLGEMRTSRFVDVASLFETPYYYWVRAVDASSNISPVHPNSNAGVTITGSRIITTDVGSNQITVDAVFTNAALMTLATSNVTDIETIGFLALNTIGQPLLLIGAAHIRQPNNSRIEPTLTIRPGSIGGAAVATTRQILTGSLTCGLTTVNYTTPPSGSVTYYLTINDNEVSNSNFVVADRVLTALETRR